MPPSGEEGPALLASRSVSNTGSSTGVAGIRNSNDPPRTRPRKSSSLGADPRGDTGANSVATANLRSQQDLSNGSPSTPSHHARGEKGRRRKRARRLLSRCKRLCLRHTWVAPLAIMLVILAGYAISPGEHNPLHAAIFLSYADPPLAERTHTLPSHIGSPTQYGKGPKDFAFVAFYTVVLSFTREFLMQRLIRPIAIWNGIRPKGKQARFMEQFYTAIYFALWGPLGLYVMSRTPVWFFNTRGMYEGFPHRAHEAYFKAYYLLQAAYWAQQGLVLMLQLEKPRKDFKELVLHHIVTLALIGLSYRFHFTYMGVAVYITHDISDFFLATSKLLNYVDSIIIGPYFVSFMCIWAYLRHFINLRILYSLFPFSLGFGTANEFATVGPYTLDWPTQQYKCWISQLITFALLAALQAVNLFWFFLICRILYRIIAQGIKKDERSDDEEEEEEEMEEWAVEEQQHQQQQQEKLKLEGKKSDTPKLELNGGPIGNGEARGEENGGLSGIIKQRKASSRKR